MSDVLQGNLILAAETTTDGNELGFWLIVLAGMAVLPFVLSMVTSFAKLVIVGGIIRQALGTQQIPPNSVITGLALILSIHIMWPVVADIYDSYESSEEKTGDVLTDLMRAATPRIKKFLKNHTDQQNIELFTNLRATLSSSEIESTLTDAGSVRTPLAKDADADKVATVGGKNDGSDQNAGERTGNEKATQKDIKSTIDELTVLVPAFILTELTEAFQIGFLIFVPFLVLDLVVSNLLLAMGMHMLSPQTVSLPLKILLFVLVDGWVMIIQGLVLGYAV